MQKITCPFCFESFGSEEMHFRCIQKSCPGKDEPDELFLKEHGRTPAVPGHVIVVQKHSKVKRSGPFGRGRIESVQCEYEGCKKEARIRLCPRCHYELKHDIDQVSQKVIAVIGGSNAGKSHYIVSLIKRLQHDIGPLFNFAVIRWSDETRERWERDFYRPLFLEHTVLQATRRAGAGNYFVKTPLVFRLTFTRGKQIEALNVSFFDTAGEDMTETNLEHLNSAEARYIARADGLIVLFDPLQIDGVRQEVAGQAPHIRLPALNLRANPQHVLERLWELLERSGRSMSGSKQIQIPVAFTLSKIDALRAIVEPDSALLRASIHNGTFDIADMQSVHTELEQRLEDWLPGFHTTLEAKFANYRFFGVSALGSQPVPGNLPHEPEHVSPSPVRVEDPFLWILCQFGLLPRKKG